ncbi:MAG: protein GumC, partial [Deltaproteobacteria bacterium]|nr:protein GumC [Deltaproteobacteria bacterium]
MKQLISLGVQDYLEIAIRRRWFIIVPFLLITIGGVFWSYRIPPAYRASTLILIQKQRVPENYIKPTVTSGIEERLHTISQQIMSRTRLEAIINELNLYPELRKALFMEEVVETMRKDISLEVKGKEAFQLFYQGRHPQLVAAVANRL